MEFRTTFIESDMPEKYDVIIVGASIAGSTTAIRLGSAGLKVALIDQHTFPRSKPCGEGLSSIGLECLEEMNLLGRVRSEPHTNFCGFNIWLPGAWSPLQLSRESGISIQRSVLDTALTKVAKETAGVSFFPGTRVLAVESGPAMVRGTVSAGEFMASFAVLACGAGSSLVRETVGPMVGKVRDRIGYTYHIECRSFHEIPSCVNIFLGNGYEVYVTVISPQAVNLTVLGTKAATHGIRRSENLAQVVDLVAQRMGFKPGEITPVGGRGDFGLRLPCSWRERLLAIGDARETFDPIGGMGMTHALMSGRLAAQALCQVCTSECSYSKVFAEYDAAVKRVARPLRGFSNLALSTLCRAAGHALPRALLRSHLPTVVDCALTQESKRSLLAQLLLFVFSLP